MYLPDDNKDDTTAEIEKEIADLFGSEQESSPAEQEAPSAPQAAPKQESKDQAKAFSIRLNEEREKIAKEAGFNSYEDMKKKRELKQMEDKGLDTDVAAPLIDDLVKQRLENDPRIKRLEELEKKEKDREFQEWTKKQLTEVNAIPGVNFKTIADIPQDVIKLSESLGSVKKAYMALHGDTVLKNLDTKQKSDESKGGTSHLAQPDGQGGTVPQTRPLTEAERKAYKMVVRGITDDELDKLRKSV
jgi:hypothetical protein